MQISAVVGVGIVDGLGQVNWRKVGLVVAWWLLGPLPLIAVACFIYWQGQPAVHLAAFHRWLHSLTQYDCQVSWHA